MEYKVGFFEKIYLAVKQKLVTTQWLRLLKIVICSTTSSLLMFVVAGSLIEEASMFTISLSPGASKGSAAISLCETADFANPTTVLDAGGLEQMTNISQLWLPGDLDSHDGSHNGDSYLAYTFYLKNVGEASGTLQESIVVDSSVLGADAAIRVQVYRNGIPTTYAKMGADGMAERGTTPFVSDDVVFANSVESFDAGQVIKYTLVIWLEGDDPECLDNIMGGTVKMSMHFSVEEEPQS